MAYSSSSVSEWHGVTVTDGRVTGLDLSDNNLSGEMPVELGNLDSLEVLYLDSNSLSGEIPSELGNLSELSSLDVSNNAITSVGSLSMLGSDA